MTKGYLGNGLFSMGERLVNKIISLRLRGEIKDLDLYVPQENPAINDKSAYADSIMITHADLGELKRCDFMVAVLDGNTIDEGLCGEVGYAYGKEIPIFGLWTDVRQFGRDNKQKVDALIEDGAENQFMYRNLLIVGMIKDTGGLYSSVEDLTEAVKAYLAEEKKKSEMRFL